MTELYFWLNTTSIVFGLLIAMMFYYIFEALRKWANKPVKETPKHENWDLTKPNLRRACSSYPSYHSYNRDRYARTQYGHVFLDTLFTTRAEANKVLDKVLKILDMYGHVSVSDFYTFVGENSNFEDTKMGWTNLDDTMVIRSGGAYAIAFSHPKKLD